MKRTVALLLIVILIASCGKFVRVINSANSSDLNLVNSDDNSSLGTVAENNDVNFSVNSENSSGLNLVNSDDNSSPDAVVENAGNNDANPFVLGLEELLNNITAMEATWTDAENDNANLINPEEE
jgi:hypothetical protein